MEVDKVRIKKIDLIKSNAILDVYYKKTSDKAEE